MSEQIDMFRQTRNAITGRTENHPARTTDPPSSHVAAQTLRRSGKLDGQRRAVLAMLARYDEPVTARTLGHGDIALYHVMARRLPELKARGLAVADAHHDGQRWRITAEGRWHVDKATTA